jgi:hypothetical protein
VFLRFPADHADLDLAIEDEAFFEATCDKPHEPLLRTARSYRSYVVAAFACVPFISNSD